VLAIFVNTKQQALRTISDQFWMKFICGLNFLFPEDLISHHMAFNLIQTHIINRYVKHIKKIAKIQYLCIFNDNDPVNQTGQSFGDVLHTNFFACKTCLTLHLAWFTNERSLPKLVQIGPKFEEKVQNFKNLKNESDFFTDF
jgi:hypothetical protein